MTVFNKKAPWLLLIGDLAIFIASLWLALAFRHGDIAEGSAFVEHLEPFSLLFVVWFLVFFISGLYDKQSVVLKSKLPLLLTQVQIVNILIAITFFYFIPWYGIAPKTTLFLYLLISLCLIVVWRIYGYFALVPSSREQAVIIGSGLEMQELVREVGGNKHYNLDFVSTIDVDTVKDVDEMANQMGEKGQNLSLVAVDLYNERIQVILPKLYNLLFSNIRFIGMDEIYEDVFDRIPPSLVKHSWFLQNISTAPKMMYDAMKRFMDILISSILGIISLVVYPFVALAIKIEDRGPVFIFQERVGKNDRVIRIAKFRSMSVAAQDETGASEPQSVTIVGSFIRKTRIDELPQLWNVLKGDLSLIGPRPELPQFVRLYEQEIPFYKIRHLIKPGLSGWAQIYHKTPPKFAASKEDTRMKLSYDLYYIKNRSFFLDLTIALKTIKELVSRKGV